MNDCWPRSLDECKKRRGCVIRDNSCVDVDCSYYDSIHACEATPFDACIFEGGIKEAVWETNERDKACPDDCRTLSLVECALYARQLEQKFVLKREQNEVG